MDACAFECSGISFYPKEGLSVSPVPPQIDVPRQLTVESFSDNKIVFKEVKEKTQLQQFDGMHLLVEADVTADLKKSEHEEYVGWNIIDKTSLKSLAVKEVVTMPTQQLALCESGEQVILHEDLIDSLDEEHQSITVVLPENYFEEL